MNQIIAFKGKRREDNNNVEWAGRGSVRVCVVWKLKKGGGDRGRQRDKHRRWEMNLSLLLFYISDNKGV